jgi:predicted HicB family RNase H-like nuclease
MSKLIHIRISPAAHKDLQREAAKDKRTLGQMARVLLEAALEARKPAKVSP